MNAHHVSGSMTPLASVAFFAVLVCQSTCTMLLIMAPFAIVRGSAVRERALTVPLIVLVLPLIPIAVGILDHDGTLPLAIHKSPGLLDRIGCAICAVPDGSVTVDTGSALAVGPVRKRDVERIARTPLVVIAIQRMIGQFGFRQESL